MDKDVQLTTNFWLSEFTRSATATAMGIDNTPNAEQIANLRTLCVHVLQPFRNYLGKALRVSSGFRSPALNAAVGGAKNSQHLTGQAADLPVAGLSQGVNWTNWMEHHLHYDQLILERSGSTYWIHVSYVKPDGYNRHQRKFIVKR